MIRVIIAVVFSLAGIGVSAESFKNTREYYELMERSATIGELVESLWKNEVECPFPPHAMTRTAFGIDTNKTYSLEEKADLIYRARELRRGRNLVVRAEVMNHRKALQSKRIPIKERGKMARDFNVARLSPKKFCETDKGRLMVEYLNGRHVGVDGLVDYLVKTETDREDYIGPTVTGRMAKPLVHMTRDEQIVWLYRAQEVRNRERKMREMLPRKPQIKLDKPKNENGKPPVRPWRANGK